MESINQNATPISVLYSDQMPEVLFDDFRKEMKSNALDVTIIPRPTSNIYAGLEWYIPSVAIIFIAKSYFDGFFGEMGKNHYNAVRITLGNLISRLLLIKVSLFGSPGKVSKEQKYSLACSLMAEIDKKHRVKFMLQNDLSRTDVQTATDAFLDFLSKLYAGDHEDRIFQKIATARIHGGTLLLTFNFDTRELDILDPIPRASEDET